MGDRAGGSSECDHGATTTATSDRAQALRRAVDRLGPAADENRPPGPELGGGPATRPRRGGASPRAGEGAEGGRPVCGRVGMRFPDQRYEVLPTASVPDGVLYRTEIP